MLLTLLGFLLALAILGGLILCTEPACAEKMYRLVAKPAPVLAPVPSRRFLSSALPWWYYAIMAPPRLTKPTQCRRSRRFRRS